MKKLLIAVLFMLVLFIFANLAYAFTADGACQYRCSVGPSGPYGGQWCFNGMVVVCDGECYITLGFQGDAWFEVDPPFTGYCSTYCCVQHFGSSSYCGTGSDDNSCYSSDGSRQVSPVSPLTGCGNGKIDSGEGCDLGLKNGFCPSTCSYTCQLQSCCTPESCNDNNPCTNDYCSDGVCTHSNVASGTECGGTVCMECRSGSCTQVTDMQQDASGPYKCEGTCKMCFDSECINQPSNQDYFNQCNGGFTCSGESIVNNNVCNSGGSCGYAVTTCSGNCNSKCVAGQSSCKDTANGFDDYNICSGGLTCSGQSIIDNSFCGSGTGCGYSSGSCSGGENSRCDSGSCVNKCGNGVNDDGDGYVADSCDPDCGTSQCTSGTCCDTSTCTYRPPDDLCGVCQTCSGSSASCSNVPNNKDFWNDCSSSFNACSGSCQRTGPDGNCDGLGSCKSSGNTGNIASGNVCTGAGLQTALSCSNYCSASGNYCSDTEDIVKNVYSCSGSGTCSSSGGLQCAVQDCSGTKPHCSDGSCVQCTSASQCADDGNPCTTTQCTSGVCSYPAGNANAVCRASQGACDLTEVCSGSSASCPSDSKRNNKYVCRDADGECDLADYCDGTNNACTSDAKSTGRCRLSAGVCDVSEFCTGSSNTCPGDSFLGSSTTCRASQGACDLTEVCSGSSVNCPSDSKRSSSYECRAWADTCDPEDYCDGTNNNCPSNYYLTGDLCGVCQTCTGSSASCSNVGANTDPWNDCNNGYSCSGELGETIYNNNVCNSGGSCGYAITTCSGNCNSKCVAGRSSCYNTLDGEDPYNICSGGLTCSGQTRIDNDLCGSSTNCGSIITPDCDPSAGKKCVAGQSTCADIPLWCGNDLMCGDGNDCTQDTCINPGTLTAYCSRSNAASGTDCGGVVCKQCNGLGSCVAMTGVQDSSGEQTCTSTCMKCDAGSCVAQRPYEDLFNQCSTGALGSATSCKSPMCSGSGASCGILDSSNVCRGAGNDCDAVDYCTTGTFACSGDSKQPANTECGDGACNQCNGLGSCVAMTDVPDSSGDVRCDGTCKKCFKGDCINQASGQDLFGDCIGNCDVCNGAGGCAASPSLCAGTCDVCSGGGVNYNCAADQSLCSACKDCSGSGTSFSCSNVANNVQDDSGTACNSLCKYCVGGSCVNVGTGLDISGDDQCTNGVCTTGFCSGGGACQFTVDGINDGCSGSQVCTGGVCTGCVSALDCPDDANPCTTKGCVAGVCTYPAGNAGTECRAALGECDIAESCTGSSTSCPVDSKKVLGTDCSGLCRSCDSAGNCVDTLAGSDYQNECTASYTACAGACQRIGRSDSCDGFGRCDTLGENIVAGNVCTGAGVQTPLSCNNFCSASSNFCSGNDLVKNVYSCSGSGACSGSNALQCVVTALGCADCVNNSDCSNAPAPVCADATHRTTYSGSCSGNACSYTPTTTACPGAAPYCSDGSCVQCSQPSQCDDSNPCTQDICSAGVCSNPAGNAGTECRAAAGVCDKPETCTGSSASCPADAKYGVSDNVCGDCQYCTGSSNSCTNVLSGADPFGSCIGNCDVCNGAGGCAANNNNCTGNCDVCSGGGVNYNCAADNASCTGNCDVCSGSGTAFNCAANNNACTGNCDVCSGSGTLFNCAANNALCSGNDGSCACSGSGNVFSCSVCSAPSVCSGGSCVGCSADSQCNDNNDCTQNRCVAGLCDYSLPAPASTVCRNSISECDVAESCTGSSTSCPVDAKKSLGSDCSGLCRSCDNAGNCANTISGLDYQNECTASFTSCSGACQRTGPSDSCNGAGACDTQLSNIAAGNVCTGAGVQTALNCGNACSFSAETCSFPDLVKTSYGCNGAGACTFAGSSCVSSPLGCAECTIDSDCNAPPNAICFSSSILTTYSGRCASSNCTYDPVNTACGLGESCTVQSGVASCSLHCSNGVIEPAYGEECDDSNLNDFDGCSSSCKLDSSINNALVFPFDCHGLNGLYCGVGNTIRININFAPVQTPRIVQTDFRTADSSCVIEYSGGDMQGMTYSGAVSSPFNYNYVIPPIPEKCMGKNLTVYDTALYNTITDPRSNYYSGASTGIVLDGCWPNVFNPYSVGGINPGVSLINNSNGCYYASCGNYVYKNIVTGINPSTHSGYVTVLNTAGSTVTFSCERSAPDGVCPDDFVYSGGCGESLGVCNFGYASGGERDYDCLDKIQMKCGVVNAPNGSVVNTCIEDSSANAPCDNSNDCVYKITPLNTLPACYGLNTKIMDDDHLIVCSLSNTWCPDGFTFNGVSCVFNGNECTISCPNATTLYSYGALTKERLKENQNINAAWHDYVYNTGCFLINNVTGRRRGYCAVAKSWPHPMLGIVPVFMSEVTTDFCEDYWVDDICGEQNSTNYLGGDGTIVR